MYNISPVRNKSLFQLFAESILAAERRYGGTIPWYIMTSDTNDRPTQEYFAANGFFGLNGANIFFFKQGMMPAIGSDGKILLDRKHRVAMSPDGHGGTLRALATTGALDDMARRGVEAISYFQVDNPLVSPVDPVFIGLHDQSESEVSSIAVRKADDLERVGNFALVDGKACVIEYSDLPEERARARDADGKRVLDLGSIAIHVFSRAFVERLTEDIRAIKLPWHRAVKKVAYIDLDTGERVVPETPNAVKLEMFVFDALPLADRTMIYLADRGEVFSPVKNAMGVDSPETSRRDIIARAAHWLELAGVTIPRTDDGQVNATLEISPLLALDAEQLAEVLRDKPDVVPGSSLYLE
jgi:UDP-N-acetylglucosamine/UDP-N-acetylgalactosamine diphosphorylase